MTISLGSWGDLNECLWAKEKKGGVTGNFQNMELFKEMVGDLKLHDLVFVGNILLG